MFYGSVVPESYVSFSLEHHLDLLPLIFLPKFIQFFMQKSSGETNDEELNLVERYQDRDSIISIHDNYNELVYINIINEHEIEGLN